MVITPIRKRSYPAFARMAVMAAALSLAAGAITPFSAAAQEGGVSGGAGPDTAEQSGPSAPEGNARDQAVTAAPAAPDAPDAPVAEVIDPSDAAAEVTGSEGGGLMGMAVPALLIVALLAFGIVLWLVFKRSKEPEMPSQRRRGAGSGEGSQQASGGFGSADQHDLGRQLGMVIARIDRMEARMTGLEQQMQSASGRASGQSSPSQAHGGVSLDRRSDPVRLPEDDQPDFRGAPAPPRRPEAQAMAAPPPPAPAPRPAESYDGFAREVATRFNDAGKPAEHEALAREYGAEYYSNERKGDIATLIKSDADRFWLIPFPHEPGRAFLIPGFAIKKSWQRYRHDTSDHPLAHHFNLTRGDKFSVNSAAIVRQDSNGYWQLERKGEVSMLS